MTRDELKLTLDRIYLVCMEIGELEGRKTFLENGWIVDPDDENENAFNLANGHKEIYYFYLNDIINQLREFLIEHRDEDYVVKTLEYMQQKQDKSSDDVTYIPSTLKHVLEMANVRMRADEFMNYVEMTIYDPLLHIMHHLYINALGESYQPGFELIFND